MFIEVGGQGKHVNELDASKTITGGYNGGGTAWRNTPDLHGVATGGGATHIAKKAGLLSSLSSSQSDILIVAGGGGGAAYAYYSDTNYYSSSGGHAGGYQGVDADGYSGFLQEDYKKACPGARQTILISPIGGEGNNHPATPGTFGQGANYSIDSNASTAGGGGGYYGGTGCRNWSGSGGSSYIGNALLTNKEMYCYDCLESTNTETKTVKTNNVSATATPKTAKQGNGYAKITLISCTN